MEKYLFDKDGFFVLRNALSAEEVEACVSTIDSIPWQDDATNPLKVRAIYTRVDLDALLSSSLATGGAECKRMVIQPAGCGRMG